jgi:hypothetical protein
MSPSNICTGVRRTIIFLASRIPNYLYGSRSGSFLQQAKLSKIWLENLISTVLWHLFILLYLKTGVNVPLVSKIIRKKLIFCEKTVKKRAEPGYPLVRSANPGPYLNVTDLGEDTHHHSNFKLLPVTMFNVDLNLLYLPSIC